MGCKDSKWELFDESVLEDIVHFLLHCGEYVGDRGVGDVPTQKSPNKRNRTGLEIFQPRRAPTTITWNLLVLLFKFI